MKTQLAKLGATAILGLGMAFQASAAPVFTVDPTVIGNDFLEGLGFADAPFESNFINGTSSSLVTLDLNTGIQSGVGWIQFTGFNDPDGGSYGGGVSGLGFTYTLWAEFQYTAEIASGTFGLAGSVSNITSLEYTLWATPNANNSTSTTTFTNANVLGTGTAPSVTPGAGLQQIGFGYLIDGTGGAGLNAQGGSFFNSVASYENTVFGSTFFVAPDPFFNVSFNEFNNTLQGVTFGNDANGNPIFAINQASGGIDFRVVPEPATLALMGLGLLGLGAVSNRRRKLALQS